MRRTPDARSQSDGQKMDRIPTPCAVADAVFGATALSLARITIAVSVLVGLTAPHNARAEDAVHSHETWLRIAVERLCPEGPLEGVLAQQRLPGVWLLKDKRARRGTRDPDKPVRLTDAFRIDQWFLLPGGHELHTRRTQLGGLLRRFSVELHRREGETLQPTLLALADGGCTVRSARRIERDAGSPRETLIHLDGDLRTERWRETLQAPWPDGQDPGGPRVAMIDSGLAFDLPVFANRLARNATGTPLGYDFWDLDPWPYDGDTARGPFLPIRHGTPVASVLVREAPLAALIPMRYPRPDMTRLGDAVRLASKAGARILAMPLGSRRRTDWDAFAAGLTEHPDMLAIVSAGNDGRDIDADPVWPAALTLDNMIVVTSLDPSGDLARGSNWGQKSVDIALPAENIPVTDFRGAKGTASGSSYAVPRLAALAARLLAADPSMSTETLKQRIFARAIPSAEGSVVAVGWIPNPAAD